MLRMIMVLWVALASYSSALARTWIVDDSGGADFTDIQSAVNAASPGDVILVRKGDYPGFTCSKNVTIRATPGRFDLLPNETILISGTPLQGVGAGQRCVLSGVKGLSEHYLQVIDCLGEVVIENVRFKPVNLSLPCAPILHIDNCANVSISDSIFFSSIRELYGDEIAGNIHISQSSVRMSDVTAVGAEAFNPLGWQDGDPGCYVDRSYVELSAPTITGGKGQDWFGNTAGDGAAGLQVIDSTIIITGDTIDSITGGAGGDGDPFYKSCGDGGQGLSMIRSTVEISRVQLIGGAAGQVGNCKPGRPFSGGVPTRDDTRPFLTLTSNLSLGSAAKATVDGAVGGFVFLLTSSRGGFVPAPTLEGPQLSVLPGPGFGAFAIGRTNLRRDVSFSFTIPDGQGFVGYPVNIQGLVLGDLGTNYLSHSVTRIIGP